MRVRIIFRKEEGARFLSHLDLMATFEYALRRGSFPVELSEGFNPRPRISMAAPLALGHVGEAEILEMTLKESMATAEVAERLQSVLPAGINVTSVGEMEPGEKLSATRLRGAVYRIELQEQVHDLKNRIEELLRQQTLSVVEHRQGGERTRDIRPFVIGLRPAGDGRTVSAEVRMDTEGSVRPEQLLDLLSIERMGARISRERLVVGD